MTAAKKAPAGPRQAAALEAIRQHWRAFGEAPTRAELGRMLGVSRETAHELVLKLERDGLVERAPRMVRNVEASEC